MSVPLERIDCQSHIISEEFVALLEKRTEPPNIIRQGDMRFLMVREWRRKLLPELLDVHAKLAAMDAAGISMTALSMNDPGPELFGDDSAAVAAMNNDFIAGLVAAYPSRFFGLAALPFGTPENMLREFERAVDKLGMKGIMLFSNLNGRFPDEEPFRPLFAEAERRGIPLVLHPARPMTLDAVRDYDMSTMLGMLFDTTIAMLRLILSGVMEQHPNLKVVCPHVGGTLPYLMGRIDYQAAVMKRGGDKMRHAPSEYLKRVWFDTVTQIPSAIRFAADFVGVDKLMYSSDHPWVQPQAIVDAVEGAGFTDRERKRIYSGTARELFSLG